MKRILFLIVIMIFGASLTAQELIIQEKELGFCAVDGAISTSVTGFTGSGYADGDPGIGKSMSWQVAINSTGKFSLNWRYGLGGNPGDRNARLIIDGQTAKDTILFPHTGQWTNWTLSSPVEINLTAGNHKIRIEAYSTSGLANFDYLKITGTGVSPAECTPSYVLTVGSNNEEWGTVSYFPVQKYYDKGTNVTLKANAKSGYFFESWTGEATSSDTVFTFAIKSNVNAVARFLPNGIKMDDDIIGYATVQDNNGTPYMVTGGALGETVEAKTLAELQNYLSSGKPYIVRFTGEITGTETIKIASDKSLIGYGPKAHLRGIEISVNAARNVIIRNISVSHVTPQDALEINGKSKNILIDHCEFFSDQNHGTDFYDGLLDIKNESSFITISWCSFHDHYKTSLISSGDQAVADSVIRVTYHHNYFYNCESRLPSIRFGRAHVFNNYYKNCNTAINSRMGAWVRVEKNYFESVNKAVMMDYSTQVGSVHLVDNYFGTSSYATEPACVFNVPYKYDKFLDEPSVLPTKIPAGVRTNISDEKEITGSFQLFQNYPNPFNPETVISYHIPVSGHVILKVYDVLGREMAELVNEFKNAGTYDLIFRASRATGPASSGEVGGPGKNSQYSSGVYFYRLTAGDYSTTKKMLLLR